MTRNMLGLAMRPLTWLLRDAHSRELPATVDQARADGFECGASGAPDGIVSTRADIGAAWQEGFNEGRMLFLA